MGQEPVSLEFPRADQNAIPPTLENALNMAQENHPVIKVAQADVDAARFQYKQSKAPNYPTLSFEAAQSWRNDAGGIEGSSDELSAMLRLRYNLYNGGSDSDRTESAAYQLNRSKDLREKTFRTVEEGLRLSWSALDLTLQQKQFWQITLILHPKRLFRIVNSIKSASVHCSISSTLRMSFRGTQGLPRCTIC